jgi:hypothetical protein
VDQNSVNRAEIILVSLWHRINARPILPSTIVEAVWVHLCRLWAFPDMSTLRGTRSMHGNNSSDASPVADASWNVPVKTHAVLISNTTGTVLLAIPAADGFPNRMSTITLIVCPIFYWLASSQVKRLLDKTRSYEEQLAFLTNDKQMALVDDSSVQNPYPKPPISATWPCNTRKWCI